MTVSSWREKISVHIEGRQEDVEDRSGRTAFGRLANDLRSVAIGSQEQKDAAKAVEELLDTYVSSNNVQYLDHLSQLIALAEIKSDALSLRAYQVWGNADLAPEIRVSLLAILCALGRRLTPNELDKETSVRELAAPVWIDAWAQSHSIQYWADQIPELLKTGQLKPAELFARLPSWYQRFGDDVLVQVLGWRELIPLGQRSTFDNWLKDRLPQQVIGAPMANLSDLDMQFLDVAYTSRASKLNGQSHPDYAE